MALAALDQQASLVEAAVAGDEAAFGRLYDAYSRSIFNMILRSVRDRELAEDVSQEVWLKAHRQIGTLRESGAFPAWLYRIAAKTCIDTARRRSRRVEGESLDADVVSAVSGDPEMSALERDEAQRVWEALAALPPHQHLALFLREVEQLPYQQIAQILGISETAAGLCLFRGRRAFAAAFSCVRERDSRDRCEAMRRFISMRLDGEATVVQVRALDAHLAGCAGCRRELATMRVSSQRYGALALVPVPALIQSKVLSTAATAQTAVTSFVAKLLASAASNAKVALVATGVAATAVANPAVVAVAIDATAAMSEHGRAEDARPVSGHAPATDAEGPAGQRSIAVDQPATAIDGPPVERPANVELPVVQPTAVAGVTLVETEELVDAIEESVASVVEGTLRAVDETLGGAIEAVDDAVAPTDGATDAVDEVLDSVPANGGELLPIDEEEVPLIDPSLLP